MKKEIIQIKNINAEDFKDEIIKVVVMALKDQLLQIETREEEEEQLLTRKETAKILSVSLVTLFDWDKKNILQSYRIGNLV
nr:DNA-binding protein [uncultured Flavobacterium sp.]